MHFLNEYFYSSLHQHFILIWWDTLDDLRGTVPLNCTYWGEVYDTDSMICFCLSESYTQQVQIQEDIWLFLHFLMPHFNQMYSSIMFPLGVRIALQITWHEWLEPAILPVLTINTHSHWALFGEHLYSCFFMQQTNHMTVGSCARIIQIQVSSLGGNVISLSLTMAWLLVPDVVGWMFLTLLISSDFDA